MPVPEAATDETAGVVVSICSVPAGLATAPVRLAALPAPSLTVAELRLTAVTARSAVFWPAHRVAEGQGIAAGAAAIGRGAAVVEGQRRDAARHRHGTAQIERQRHHAAGRKVAGAGVMPVPDATTEAPKAPWCRSADRSASVQTATGWRHFRRCPASSHR